AKALPATSCVTYKGLTKRSTSTTVVDRMLSWFHTHCGGRNHGAESRAVPITNRRGPGDGASLGRMADRSRTSHHATLCPPRSPSPSVGVSPRAAESRRAQEGMAGGRLRWGDDDVWPR